MITLWHNPRCSKSRQTLALLQERGMDVTLRLYLKDAPTLAELTAVQSALGVPAIDMMRPKEKAFKEAGLSKTDTDAALLHAIIAHPVLLERPIAVAGGTAAIGRPPENVLSLLD